MRILSLLILLFSIGREANSSTLYHDISVANGSDSLIKILNIQLKYFGFKYDTIPGRKQLGVFVDDAIAIFPEVVDMVPKFTYFDGTKTNVISNFPIVDKTAVLMHGLVALQEMIRSTHDLTNKITTIEQKYQSLSNISSQFEEFIEAIDKEKKLSLLELTESQLELAQIESKKTKLISEKELKFDNLRLLEEKKRLEYEESLIIRRQQYEENLARESLKEKLELEKNLAQQREVLRRQTQENIQLKKGQYNKELELQKIELEKEKITSELEAKARQELINEDLAIRKMQLQAKLDTERVVEIIRAISTQVSRLISDLFSNPMQLAIFVITILSFFFLSYIFKELVSGLKLFFESKLGKPKLVRETSFQWGISGWISNMKSLLFMETIHNTSSFIKSRFANVILSSQEKERIIQLAIATRNTKQSGAVYRHVLLFGPSGTGKTLIARKLAECSGMDYAIMSGGDIRPLGDEAVTQLNNLFNWASRSKRGLLIFIDEAESFLSSRYQKSDEKQDIHTRNALNSLLYQTGTQSKNFMLVLATNIPDQLDPGILDRIDVSLKIDLPKYEQRIDLVHLYSSISLRVPTKRHWLGKIPFLSTSNENMLSKFKIEDVFTDQYIRDLSTKLNGFSGREIAKLFVSIQNAFFLLSKSSFSKELIDEVINSRVEEHLIKNKLFKK